MPGMEGLLRVHMSSLDETEAQRQTQRPRQQRPFAVKQLAAQQRAHPQADAGSDVKVPSEFPCCFSLLTCRRDERLRGAASMAASRSAARFRAATLSSSPGSTPSHIESRSARSALLREPLSRSVSSVISCKGGAQQTSSLACEGENVLTSTLLHILVAQLAVATGNGMSLKPGRRAPLSAVRQDTNDMAQKETGRWRSCSALCAVEWQRSPDAPHLDAGAGDRPLGHVGAAAGLVAPLARPGRRLLAVQPAVLLAHGQKEVARPAGVAPQRLRPQLVGVRPPAQLLRLRSVVWMF
jgi:hypothetical protein